MIVQIVWFLGFLGSVGLTRLAFVAKAVGVALDVEDGGAVEKAYHRSSRIDSLLRSSGFDPGAGQTDPASESSPSADPACGVAAFHRRWLRSDTQNDLYISLYQCDRDPDNPFLFDGIRSNARRSHEEAEDLHDERPRLHGNGNPNRTAAALCGRKTPAQPRIPPTAPHGSCRSAFRNALTAHLALWRRLELKDDEKIVDWLLHLSSEDFGRWLDMTERNGSVSGSIN
jgi:hypothetical protein